MSKKSVRKQSGKGLTKEEKALGKNNVYIILGMIAVGLLVALYRINS